MIKISSIILMALSAVSYCQLAAQAQKQASAPDLIVYNANILTMDERKPHATAMAVSGQKITALDEIPLSIVALKDKHTVLLDAGKNLITPGLHDSHMHLAEGGIELKQLSLKGSKNKSVIMARVKAYAAAHPQLTEIVATGLPLPAIAQGDISGRDFDAVERLRPLVIYSEDAHTAWLNSRAIARIRPADLRRLQQSKSARDMIEVDAKGSLTGVVREQGLSLLDNVITGMSASERADALFDAAKLANSFGITSIQDAHATDEVVDAYQTLSSAKRLNVRVAMALHTDPALGAGNIKHLLAVQKRISTTCNTDSLKVTGAKIFLDGVIETGTAALLKPYAGDFKGRLQRPTGQANYEQAGLDSMVAALVQNNLQIHVHAIGDRAVRMALDSMQKVQQLSAQKDLRHHIAHLEMVDAADVPRFKTLGVTANWQAFWAFLDPYVVQLTIPKLGERAKRIYPIGEIARSGARLAAGSDWTVSTLNPLDAMQVAVTRKGLVPDGKPALGDNEQISLEQILRAYTTGGAYVNHSDKYTGTLSAGKYADFAIFDRDFTKGSANKIHEAKVLRTYLGGKLVFKADHTKVRDNN